MQFLLDSFIVGWVAESTWLISLCWLFYSRILVDMIAVNGIKLVRVSGIGYCASIGVFYSGFKVVVTRSGRRLLQGDLCWLLDKVNANSVLFR